VRFGILGAKTNPSTCIIRASRSGATAHLTDPRTVAQRSKRVKSDIQDGTLSAVAQSISQFVAGAEIAQSAGQCKSTHSGPRHHRAECCTSVERVHGKSESKSDLSPGQSSHLFCVD
jgi:hypothetical protein